jgi:hypothetical protein
LLFDFGNVNFATVAEILIEISAITLAPGLYYMAFTASTSNAGAWRGIALTALPGPVGGFKSNNLANTFIDIYNTNSYNEPFPVSANPALMSFANTGQHLPYIQFRKG